MLRRRSRVLIALASLALGLVYFAPLWKIDLVAPQYPEGLGMLIGVNSITGAGPHDLQNINGLNHYIGMAPIVPDSIPELQIMPWVFGLFLVTGLLVAWLGRRVPFFIWTSLFVIMAVVGLADFYKWEYEYGHNLDPTAAIQVPGLSYQPPLIGEREILNFTAKAWPGLGGWAAIAAGLIATGVMFTEVRGGAKQTQGQVPSAEPSHRPKEVPV
ncbi:MAG: hypothetical protein ACR2QM_00740 [Longimicrobiales bacterium]